MNEYEIVIPSNRPAMAASVVRALRGEPVRVLANERYPSFAKLVNDCVRSSTAETVIIANDKTYPTRTHVRRLLALLSKGYGLVGLGQFHFFGFPRELFRRIGGFDERFIGGEFEDDDYLLRMMEADIAYLGLTELTERRMPTTWSREKTLPFFQSKWDVLPDGVRRLLPEGDGYHDFGTADGRRFLPWRDSSTRGWVGARYIGLRALPSLAGIERA